MRKLELELALITADVLTIYTCVINKINEVCQEPAVGLTGFLSSYHCGY